MTSASQPLLLDVPPSSAPPRADSNNFARTAKLSPASAPAASVPQLAARSLLAWLVDEIFRPAFRALVATRPVWHWADENVSLSGVSTGRGGKYRSARTPWTRQFQETFTDPRWSEDHVMKSSRTGFTEAALNVIRYMPQHAPGPVHLALDSAKAATDVNRERLTPTLRAALAEGEWELIDDNDITARVIRLRNMVIRVTGSYTEGAFRQHGNRLVVLDEVEVVNEIPGVGTLHDLARSRLRGVDGAKLLTMSKPVKWGSAHHCEVVTGTLSVELFPCPHCGTFQELTVDGRSLVDQLRIERPLRAGQPPLSPKLSHVSPPLGRLVYDHAKMLDGTWDLERILRETFYQCVNGCAIHQDAPLHPSALEYMSDEVRTLTADGRAFTCKEAMTLSGQWLRTNPRSVPAKRSRHTSDLSSLDADMTWGHFALKWVTAQSDPVKIRTALNEHFGLPARDKAAEVGEEHILELRAPYRRGTCPFVPDIVTTSADTQDAYWKHVTLAARLNSAGTAYAEFAVISWGIATTEADLIAELAQPIAAPDGVTTFSVGGLVDAGGHRTDEVYKLHFASGFRYFASFGRDSKNLTKPVWESEIEWRMAKLRIYFYADDLWKRRLYLGMVLRGRETRAAVREKKLDPDALQLPAILRTPGEPTDGALREFESELQGERLTEDGDWENVKGHRNDFGDALKTALVSLDLRLPLLIAQRAKAKAEAEAAAKGKGKP